jgi:rod shape-determining protein MreC
MRNLLNFLARFNNLIIFLILEGIALYLVTTRNTYHNSRALNVFNYMTHGIETRINNASSYLSLRDINVRLATENVALKNRLDEKVIAMNSLFSSVTDTIYSQQYTHTSAEVINNSTNRQKNFFTLNKGTYQGIKVGMAVVDGFGVAGVIVGSNNNYSVAMSVLNLDFKLSARIKSNGYFGSLNWDGRDYRRAILNEIPQHVMVNIGDTIETTGYSAIFPEGIMIGIVDDFEKVGGDFYKISVLLTTDFKKLHFADVIGNLKKKEQLQIESQFQ